MNRCLLSTALASLLIASPSIAESRALAPLPQEQGDTDDGDEKKEEKKEEEEDPEKERAEKQKKAEKTQRDLVIAKMELQIAEIGVKLAEGQARAELDKARRSLKEAQGALEAFVEREMPVKIEQAQIGLDRSRHGADHALDELNELKAMYAQDEFAELTKELVLKRSERRLELSRRGLEVEKAKLDNLTEDELPRKRRSLQNKVEDAERALMTAELKHEKTALENMVKMTKAKNKLLELGSQLDELESTKP